MSPDNEGTDNNTGINVAVSSSTRANIKPATNGGRSASSTNYTVAEHISMLNIIASIDGAFESGVGSSSWLQVHTRSNTSRSKESLHTHFTEMKSALSSAISTLSAQTPSVQLPTEAADLPVFYCVLFTELFKGSKENKNYQSSKWWSEEVVSRLTCLHFDYLKKNGTGKVQTVQTLIDLGAESKRKYWTYWTCWTYWTGWTCWT